MKIYCMGLTTDITRRSLMKKQDLINLAIIGMMAGTATLGAQGMQQPAPNGSCNGTSPGRGTTQPAPRGSCSNSPQPAPNGNGNYYQQGPNGSSNNSYQQSPSSSCSGKTAQSRKYGVDTSIHSNYSNSNEQKASANRSFESKCGANSCDNPDGTPPPPTPGSGSARTRRSSAN